MFQNFKPHTANFIKAVVNPIMAEDSALVPDLEQADSICLTDYIENSRPVNLTSTAASGMLIGLRVHESPFYSTVGNTTITGSGGLIYSLIYFWVNANGVALTNTVNPPLYNELAPANIYTIQGAGGTPDPNTSLITGMRLFSMGLRVLPTVEMVTDSTITYLVRIIGGQISMQEVNAWLAAGTNIETIIRNSSCAETYANNEGCCVRYDPFQNEIQLRTQGLDDCLSTAQSFAFHKMPFIFVRFSNTVPSAAAAPLITHARFWVHGILRKPTPIYAQQSKADPHYPLLRTILSGCHPEFPLVTKGHSFPVLASVVLNALRIINRATGTALRIADTDLTGIINPPRNSRQINNRKRRQQSRQPLPGSRVQRKVMGRNPPNVRFNNKRGRGRGVYRPRQ